jgi:hypothetical protein
MDVAVGVSPGYGGKAPLQEKRILWPRLIARGSPSQFDCGQMFYLNLDLGRHRPNCAGHPCRSSLPPAIWSRRHSPACCLAPAAAPARAAGLVPPQALSLASFRSRAPSRSRGPASRRPAPCAGPQQVLRRGARFAIHGTRMATPRSPAAPRHAGPGQQPIRRARAGQCREKVAIIE